MAAASLFFTSTSWSAETYTVEGVDADNLLNSERFYDNGKGYYWPWTGYTPFKGATNLYKKTGSYAFLGDLSSRVGTASGISANTFSQLKNDANTCWYNVATNILQYWEGYYGVFGDDAIYGYTYNKDYADDLGGTQSLKIGMHFYDNWDNEGGNLQMAAGWYLVGDSAVQSSITEGKLNYRNQGGFFSQYFGEEESATRYSYTEDLGVADFADVLASHLGYEKQKGGGYKLVRHGQIADISICYYGAGNVRYGHALTCYGFTVGDDGVIESLQLTNSDDQEYELFTLYVKYTNGQYRLFTDAACLREWVYSKSTWMIESISSIATPQVLQQMYAEYTDADNPLVWNGQAEAWSTTTPPTGVELPVAEDGWSVDVGGELYASFGDSARKVCFDDRAASGQVSVRGAVATPELHLCNSSLDYTFTGSSSATIKADTLRTSGGGHAAFRHIVLSGGIAQLNYYTLELGVGSSMSYQSAALSAGTSLSFTGGSAQFESLTLGSHSSLLIGADAHLTAQTMVCGSSVTFNFTSAGALLDFDGTLTAASPIFIEMTGNAVAGSLYALVHFDDGLSQWDDVFHSAFGTLSFSNNTLYLSYAPVVQKSFGRDFSTISSALEDAALFFDGSTTGTVAVDGEAQVYALDVTAGSYVLQDGSAPGKLSVESSITVSGEAHLESRLSSLGGNLIYLEDQAQLTLASSTQCTISLLAAAADTTVSINSGTTALFEDVESLGTLQVASNAVAVFANDHDVAIAGTLSGSGAVKFTNGSDSSAVVYTLTSTQHTFSNITVGSTNLASSPRAILAIPSAKTGQFNILADGELRLLQNGEFAATATGTGCLSIAQGANVQLRVKNSSMTFASTLDVMVQGTATVGSESSLVSGKWASDVSVSGKLTVYGKTGAVSMDSLALNGGFVSFENVYASGTGYEPFVRSLGNVVVGEKGGTIYDKFEDGYGKLHSKININSLTGSGDLSLQGSSFLTMHRFRIESVGSAGYDGNITLLHDSRTYNTSYYQGSVLELGNVQMDGSVTLQSLSPGNSTEVNSLFITALGIDGNVTIGGLNSLESPSTQIHLYSGNLLDSLGDLSSSKTFSSFVSEEAHTLTIDSDSHHHFAGTVGGSLSLVKKGKGEQSFLGDMSDFNGSVDVQGGTLRIQDAFNAASVRVSQASLLSAGTVNAGSSLTMAGASLAAKTLTSSAGQFSGINRIDTEDYTKGGTWTLNITTEHAAQAVITLSGSLSLTSIVVQYDAAQMFAADYVLLRSEEEVSLASMPTNTRWVTESIGGVRYYTLLYYLAEGGLLAPRNTPTTLTWNDASGVWAAQRGHDEKSWSASESVHNRNFYDGDTVVFNHEAAISIEGVVKPALVTVGNMNGTVSFSGSGKISGTASLSKSGNGTLVIQTAHDYTGGTAISGGIVRIGHVSALGAGAVDIQNATLDVADLALGNNIKTSGVTTLNNAENYQGQLTVLNGSLSGHVGLTRTATFKGGTVNAVLSGVGGVQVSGSVTLSGANTYSGKTILNAAQLTVGHASALGSGAISSSSTSSITVSSGVTLALTSAISNGGTLSLSGHFDASALESKSISSVKVNTAGLVGKSGFNSSGGYTVQMVQGGSVRDTGAVIHYGSDILSLGTNGVATRAAVIDYSYYEVGSGDSSCVSDINSVAASHGVADVGITLSDGSLDLDADVTGQLILRGGELSMNQGEISIEGMLSLEKKTYLTLSDFFEVGKTYTLLSAESLNGDFINNLIVHESARRSYSLSVVDNTLSLTVTGTQASLTWANEKNAVWQESAGGWREGLPFHRGDSVTIGDATVSIVGEVAPNSILLNPDKALTLKTSFDKKTGEWSGFIAGHAQVIIDAAPKGKVTLNDGNTYTGTTIIESGMVSVGGVDSFGESEVSIYGGTLDLKSKAVENAITLAGDASIKGGAKYMGKFTMNSGELLKGSVLNIAES
ncbi:MAG: autotransporter-associated beta strand repeat-containing protein, partial [Akkermansia sp.]|nr:autotransporter-associated beta strand repeat-containing protein [Akkermansia sp.]